MTDRYIAFTVVLDREVREDDAEPILKAIAMIKGVREVVPLVADPGIYWAKETARHELGQQLFGILYPKKVTT